MRQIACREYRGSQRYDCTPGETDKLMRDMARFFRSSDGSIVQRWAWFGTVKELTQPADVNVLIGANGKANALGKTYAGL